MNDDLQYWKEVEGLFAEAVDLAEDAVPAFLASAAGAQPTVRRAVESLLRAHRRANGFLTVVHGDAPDAHTPSPIGTVIGAFRLKELIGAGGMGAVYRAERADGSFAQSVAIKLLALPAGHPATVRSFKAERQILGSLHHPHIVTLLDGDITPEGQAYLVMEYVQGVPISLYCQRHRLDLNARVRLFIQVCGAVQYAHRHFVVHRDLKPANILITDEGIPKIVDFGIAKLLEASRLGDTAATIAHLRPFTPDYASPEQLRGLPVTTASDVYTLGVLLYELTTGTRPYETSGRAFDDVMRIVVDQMPVRPSSASPGSTSGPPYNVAKALKGDLDAIILHAMSKEPERRYATAAELGDDLQHFLRRLPVRAQPDRATYRAAKFVRRHRAGVAATAVALVSLLVGLGVAVRQTSVARAERDRAQAEAAKAQQMAAFLGGIFQSANPVQAQGATVSARDLLDRGTASIRSSLSAQPEVQASLLMTMVDAYDRLGAESTALELAEQALALRERVVPPPRADIAASLHRVGRFLRRLGRPDRAIPVLERAVVVREAVNGADHLEVAAALRELAIALEDLGEWARSRAAYERAIGITERRAPGTARLALLYNNLGNSFARDGRFAEARTAFDRSIALYERIEGAESWGLAMPLLSLGIMLRDLEELPEARRLFERALEIDNRVFGVDSSASAYSLARLGDVVLAEGDRDRARTLLERSQRLHEQWDPPDHANHVAPLTALGRLYLAEAHAARALPLFERALQIQTHIHGPRHPAVAEAMLEVAAVRWALDGAPAAERLLRQALAIQREMQPARHWSLVRVLTTLGSVLADLGRAEEANVLLAEAVDIARERLAERHPRRVDAERAFRALDTRRSASSRNR